MFSPSKIGKQRASSFSAYLFVLVGRDRDELSLLEHVGPERGVGQLQDVVGPHQVKPRLVLVHRVQDRLRIGK